MEVAWIGESQLDSIALRRFGMEKELAELPFKLCPVPCAGLEEIEGAGGILTG